MNQPAISAIIPTRNRPVMLMKAIQSVLVQTVQCTEIIVVNDSTDPAIEVAIKKKFNDNRIIVLHTGANKGGGVARNLGIQHAKGDFIAFLDDDDEWVPEKIAKQLAMLTMDSALLYAGRNILKENRTVSRYSFHGPAYDNDHYKSIMCKNFIGTTSSVIISKIVLEQIGGFDPLLPALQDYDLYIRILKNHRVQWINEPLINYYDHHTGDQVSGNREFFFNAVSLLLNKYASDPYLKYLKSSLFRINLLKMIRSRHFLVATLKAGFRR